jgi:hypothetical protein
MVKVLRIGYAPWPAAAAFLRRTAIAAAGSHARRWLADAGIAAIVTGASLAGTLPPSSGITRAHG